MTSYLRGPCPFPSPTPNMSLTHSASRKIPRPIGPLVSLCFLEKGDETNLNPNSLLHTLHKTTFPGSMLHSTANHPDNFYQCFSNAPKDRLDNGTKKSTWRKRLESWHGLVMGTERNRLERLHGLGMGTKGKATCRCKSRDLEVDDHEEDDDSRQQVGDVGHVVAVEGVL